MKKIILPSKVISSESPVFIIAEAGVNHNGDLSLAKKLIDVAADAGADAVKFQTFKAENIILTNAPKAQYHLETTGSDQEQSWFDLLKSQELSYDMHVELIEYCNQKALVFLSTPYDIESVDLLDKLNIPLFKIASTDANNIPFLQYVASKRRPMILSTAMCDFAEVDLSVRTIKETGLEELMVMQCTGSYPAPYDQANLRVMATYEKKLDVLVGYSDHVPGNDIGCAAIALGAKAYEKHFTLDRSLPGPDHRASLEPIELKQLIHSIRAIEAALGNGEKRVMPCEVENRKKLRKFITTVEPIAKGEVIELHHLTAKRTGGQGIPPSDYKQLINKKAAMKIKKNQIITMDMVI